MRRLGRLAPRSVESRPAACWRLDPRSRTRVRPDRLHRPGCKLDRHGVHATKLGHRLYCHERFDRGTSGFKAVASIVTINAEVPAMMLLLAFAVCVIMIVCAGF